MKSIKNVFGNVFGKVKTILCDRHGSSVFSDNAGFIIVGIILIAIIIVWARPYLQNTLLPMLGNKVQELFNL